MMNATRPFAGTTVAALAALLLAAGHLYAAPIVFFGEDADADHTIPDPSAALDAQADFLANIESPIVEDFSGFDVGDSFPLVIQFGDTTATLSGTNENGGTGIQDDAAPFDVFPVIGEQFLRVGPPDTESFTLTFSEAQAAFGFFGTDIGDTPIPGQLVVVLNDDEDREFVVAHSTGTEFDGAVFFWGIIDTDDPFTRITFANTSEGSTDGWGFDGLAIATSEQVIPTPTAGLMGLALLGGLAARRPRRR